MKAVKANKEYNVDESSKKSYLAQGYNIVDDKGKIIERSPVSTVKYSEYEKVVAEKEALRAEKEALKAEKEALKAAKEALEAKNAALMSELEKAAGEEKTDTKKK